MSHSLATILTLGTAQDGGFPHTGCIKSCCIDAWNDPKLKRLLSSLAILINNKCWLIDITPDFSLQLHMIQNEYSNKIEIAGVFITHAHIGHYTGLLELGLEVMHTRNIPIYVMPKMKQFLEENAPFTQLIDLHNIELNEMVANRAVSLNETISVTPFYVPHRNEFSETVGFQVKSKNTSLIYISDIDSWDDWDVDINYIIKSNDIALLDGTFFDSDELGSRNIHDVPHPFIKDSLKRFSLLDRVDREKVYFTHFNHTNPLIRESRDELRKFEKHGCRLAQDGMKFTL
tara:strand:- start:2272 stop:3135 length:864 start_codon:yes stop_codon:yes gene_type:complete